MGGFKESLNDLEIYRLQSNSGQSIQNPNTGKTEGSPSPFERRYLAKRQLDREESIKAFNIIKENLPTNSSSEQRLLASESSLEKLASHFNSKLKTKGK